MNKANIEWAVEETDRGMVLRGELNGVLAMATMEYAVIGYGERWYDVVEAAITVEDELEEVLIKQEEEAQEHRVQYYVDCLRKAEEAARRMDALGAYSAAKAIREEAFFPYQNFRQMLGIEALKADQDGSEYRSFCVQCSGTGRDFSNNGMCQDCMGAGFTWEDEHPEK